MPASVQHLGQNCFRLRLDYNEAHWQQWDLCRVDDGLQVRAQRNGQAWDFGSVTVENIGELTCEGGLLPLADHAAAAGPLVCTGTNTATEGTVVSTTTTEFLGTEPVEVDGREVRAVRLRDRGSVTGSQRGESATEWWLDPDTGLPLRSQRSVRIESESPVGKVTYTETGRWRLRSRQPQN
jgi:hypothetical protein